MKYVCFRYPRNRVTDFLICLLCVFLIMLIFQFDASVVTVSSINNRLVLEFLEDNGWVVDESSLVFAEIKLNFESDMLLKDYAELQNLQGFSIKQYIGKTVQKFSYNVLNFPGYINDPGIYANVFIYQDDIIAADICSVRIDGFLQGAVINENQVG